MGTERPLLISRMPSACKNERDIVARNPERVPDLRPTVATGTDHLRPMRGCFVHPPTAGHLTPLVGVVTVSPVLRRPRELSKRALARGAVVFTLTTLTAGGCGPIEYLNQVSSKAATAVVAAKQAQADRYAPYEYTAAQEYLHKAREEAGYAEYQDAIEYGHRAEDLATRARAIALSRLNPPAGGHAAPAEIPAPGPSPATGRSRPGRKAKPAPAPGSDDEEPRTIEPRRGSAKSPESE